MPIDSKKIRELRASLEKVNDLGTESQEVFKDISRAIGNAAKQSQDLKGALEAANGTQKDLAKSASVLASFTEKDLKDRKAANKLQAEADKLAKRRVKLEGEMRNLSAKITNLKGKEKANAEKTLENLQNSVAYVAEMEGEFNNILDVNKEINQSTKWLDTIEESLKSLPGIGPLISGPFKKAADTVREAAAEGDGFFKRMGKGALALGDSLGPAFLLKSIFAINSRLVDMQRSLQLSESDAEALNSHFDDVAISSGKALHNQTQLLESYKELSQEIGVTSGFSDDMVKNQSFLTKRIGVSAKSAAEFSKYQAFTNKSAKETNLEIADQVANLRKETGISVKLSDVMEEVANSSAGIQAAYGFSNKALAKAVTLAKKYGINLAQAEKISSSMLDFESSIQSELEAELLTGKQLNLEKARSLALEGKSADAAAEILKQVGSARDLTKMNVIQQEALAKAAGMERNELIASVKEKETLRKLGQKSIEDALKAGKTREEIIAAGGEELLQAHERESQAEKFEASVIKIQKAIESMANAFEPIVGFFADVLGTTAGINTAIGLIVGVGMVSMVAKLVTTIGHLSTILGLNTAITAEKGLQNVANVTAIAEETTKEGIMASQAVTQTVQTSQKVAGNVAAGAGIAAETTKAGMMAAQAAAATTTNAMATFGLGTVIAVGAVTAALAALGTYLFMKDGVIGPGGEMVVSGPKGSIQLDKDDSIIAGTNLGIGKGNNTSSPPPSSSQANSDNKKMLALLEKISNKNTVIEMGGNQVGQGINTDSRAVQ